LKNLDSFCHLIVFLLEIWYNDSKENVFIYYIIKKRKEKEMFEFLSNFFQKNNIELFDATPLSSCRVIKPYLLEREGFTDGTVIIFAVPYLTQEALAPNRNVSSYAVSKDYHLFFAELFNTLLPLLKATYPNHRFSGFADHSPIDEVHAAASAGLGVIGRNGLLITEKYSSYVFLGEIITDARLEVFPKKVCCCERCGKCDTICPSKISGNECLSSLTQKKGILKGAEEEYILKFQSAWGCDLCQEVCPHTAQALLRGSIFTPIAFFYNCVIPHLSSQMIASMSERAFSERAYAWRKKETLLRNLRLLENSEKKGF
jgi:epoxyqueuosine reductase